MSIDLQYPIGRFSPPATATPANRSVWIARIELLPGLLEKAVLGLSDEQLDAPYRPGGWTVRQVVHHLPDSHMNAFVRFRLALTEDTPRIKPYDEKRWAELADSKTAAIFDSLALMSSLHSRWTTMLRSMTEEDWTRAYEHPESGRYPLTRALAMYAWHGEHHVAHITALRAREGW